MTESSALPKPIRRPLHNRVNRRELKARLQASHDPRVTLSYYKYANIDDPARFRDDLYRLYSELGVLGRIYVAAEGVNAQLSVPESNWPAFREAMDTMPMFRGMRLNVAVEADGKSFFALIIKVRHKIVADGIEDPTFDPSRTGQHLNAEAFNRLTDDPQTIVVDMRNHYESEVGHFEGAITPDAVTFREELPMVADLLADQKDRNIVMYCTGGIRCEKASAYMKYRGFQNVFQLEGGIIEYTRQAQAQGLKNKFIGKNFVFDERLGERISDDVIAHCHQCGSAADAHTNCANPHCHILFIQCPNCSEQYAGCCSDTCRDFMALPEESRHEEAKNWAFNGSKFGKGVYKAFRKSAHSLR
ncbi:MAG TPA: rhodanese-related sulfurtransferase [Saprospiraceae bacterium]|nr:rhodanese-related sulfurtransferase [Saprospiraceae bacterium]